MTVKAKLVQGGDGTAIPSGVVGEKIESGLSAVSAGTPYGTFGSTVASVTLTVGVWLVFGKSSFGVGTTAQSCIARYVIKGAAGGTEEVNIFAASGVGDAADKRINCAMAPIVVSIVSGDATKTVTIEGSSNTATICRASLLAVRIA